MQNITVNPIKVNRALRLSQIGGNPGSASATEVAPILQITKILPR